MWKDVKRRKQKPIPIRQHSREVLVSSRKWLEKGVLELIHWLTEAINPVLDALKTCLGREIETEKPTIFYGVSLQA